MMTFDNELPSEVHGKTDSEYHDDWWTKSKGDCHEELFYAVRQIDEQTERRTEQLQAARLYADQDILTYAPDIKSSMMSVMPSNRPTYNLISSVCDTLGSRIAKNKPRPFFLTTKGNDEKKKKAKKLQQFMDGWFDKEKLYDKSKSVFRDGALMKLGALKFYEDTNDNNEKDLKCERVCPLELSCDEIDGLYAKPKNLYQTKWLKVSVLENLYPKFIPQIRQASTEMAYSNQAVVRVVESWRLKERHVIAIETATLRDEAYTKSRFPFAFWRYDEALIGFWGDDIVHRITPIQLEINKIMKMISKSIEMVAVPKVFLTNTASIPKVTLNNKIGQIITHAAGQPPQFYTPQAMNQEVYEYLKWLIDYGYNLAGVSQMSATSEKPAGLSSGKAIRTYEEVASDRFALTAQRWDAFFLDCSDIIADMARDLYKGKEVRIESDKFIETIPWDEINLVKDEYTLRVFSTSLLPTHPAAKIETAKELAEMGVISPDRLPDLLDFPDIEKYSDEKSGTSSLVAYQLDSIMDKKNYKAPDPNMNMQQALELANSRMLNAMANGVSEDVLELMARYIDQIEEFTAPAQPAMPPMGDPNAMPPMPGGMPPELAGMPMPPADMGAMPPDMGALPPPEMPIDATGEGMPIDPAMMM
jgi:hypothetical protein